jgi:hypothetical protein
LGTENSLAEINLESTGDDRVMTLLGVKNWQTLATLWGNALSCNKKKSREPISSFRIQITTDFGMFKDCVMLVDVIQRSFLTKLAATAAMFTAVQANFGRPPLSSSSTSSFSQS